MRLPPSILALTLAGCLGSCKDGDVPPDDAPAEPVAVGPVEDPDPARGRVVILGFDGVDPDWVERWRRDLPNIESILRGKPVPRLQTTAPPQSAVAWATFATGTLPGKHGVFGLVGRDLEDLTPVPSALDYAPFGGDGASDMPRFSSRRHGTPFWEPIAAAGLRSRLFWVPYDYPLHPVAGLQQLAGVGLPDLRLTNSSFTVFGTDVTAVDAAKPIAGGQLVALSGESPYTAQLDGPYMADGHRASAAIRFEVLDDAQLRVSAGPASVSVRAGAFSDPLPVEFSVADGDVVRGLVRLLPLEVKDGLRVYASPIALDPRAPAFPVSDPPTLAAELAEQYGDYRVLGWEYDTAAVNAGYLSEQVFLHDQSALFEQRLDLVVSELQRRDAELFVACFTEPDRISHLFMRLMDPSHTAYDARLAAEFGGVVKEAYVAMDRAIGAVHAALKPGDTLIVVSDHGFQSFKRELHVNRWLVEQGYLVLNKDAAPGEGVSIWGGAVDWKRTRAYAVGMGSLYLNLEGREPAGSVPPARAEALVAEIAGKLKELRDGGRPVVKSVASGRALYTGPEVEGAPDLVLALEDGYQSSRDTSMGLIPSAMFADNRQKWSGDHASSDPADTPGFLVTTLPAIPKQVALADVGPTAAALLGQQPADGLDGKSWVEVRPRPVVEIEEPRPVQPVAPPPTTP